MGSVPDLERILTQSLEPAGKLHVDVAVDGAPEERFRGSHGQGKVAVAGDDDLAGAVVARERLPLRLSEHHSRAGLDDGELLGGDRLAGRAEHVGVLQRDVRQNLNR